MKDNLNAQKIALLMSATFIAEQILEDARLVIPDMDAKSCEEFRQYLVRLLHIMHSEGHVGRP